MPSSTAPTRRRPCSPTRVLAGEVLGAVAALLTVADGAQEAMTAALGGAADAVAVASLDAAVTVMRQLKAADAGSAELVIAGDDARQAPAGRSPASATRRAFCPSLIL